MVGGTRGIERGRAVGLALVVVSACGFGSGALFAKPVYGAGLDWLALLAWRFLFAAILSWVWLLAWPDQRRALRRITRRRLVVLLALGTLYVGNSATYFAALETVPASLAALIVYIYPALVAVMAIRFGRRLEGRRAWGALAVATLGVILAVGGIDPTGAPPALGLALAVASPVIYAVWIVLSARLGGERRDDTTRATAAPRASLVTSTQDAAGDDDAPRILPHDAPPEPQPERTAEETEPAPAAAVMMTATAVIYWVAATLGGRPTNPADVPPEAWWGLLGVGIFSTAIAVQTFYAGARRVGAAQAALVSTVEPVYTITLATLLFGERLTPLQVVGGMLVIGAVLVAQTGRRSEPAGLRAAAGRATG